MANYANLAVQKLIFISWSFRLLRGHFNGHIYFHRAWCPTDPRLLGGMTYVLTCELTRCAISNLVRWVSFVALTDLSTESHENLKDGADNRGKNPCQMRPWRCTEQDGLLGGIFAFWVHVWAQYSFNCVLCGHYSAILVYDSFRRAGFRHSSKLAFFKCWKHTSNHRLNMAIMPLMKIKTLYI